ncbi:PilZ domain-containing protein [Desulfonatronovibrio hydrogenovorans]|uniref:PilZ domain-containing protein n=1 Tax=Desulfonatronovibrio hydrogenovorans TaxID=53245 RepID=UPI00068B50F8|nr:PilZ domain-containing protein [Desulfonatronovibrio hydrogenovorans]
MADFFDQLDLEYQSTTQRKAYRVNIPDLKISFGNDPELYPALDISARGVAFSIGKDQKPALSPGGQAELSLVIRDKVYLKDLQARVVKLKDNFGACEFQDLPLRQEALLDKLVLEVQKKMIELQRKQKEQEKEEDEEK